MSRFVAGLDNNRRKGLVPGEKGTLEHTLQDMQDARVALFFALVRDISADRIMELFRECTKNTPDHMQAEVVSDIFVMAFQTRDCRGGKGERDIFYKMLLPLFKKYPSTVLNLIPLIAEYGYYKDYFRLLEILGDRDEYVPLRERITDIISNQLIADESLIDNAQANGTTASQLAEIRRKVSMCAKYVPREGKRFAKNKVLKSIAEKMFPDDVFIAKMLYRKTVSKITAFLDVTEVKMCGKRYSDIDYSRVPSICSKKFCKAFLNEKVKTPPSADDYETGNRFPHDEDRILSRAHLRQTIFDGKVKGKQLYPHQIVETLHGGKSVGSLETEMLNIQWNDIRQHLLTQLAAAANDGSTDANINVGKLVPLSDVSGSMHGTPMLVSIALGILISEINHPAFRDRVVTFETRPQWVDLSKCGSIGEKVKKLGGAPWGGSTNIEAAFDLIAEVVRKNKLPMEEVPDLVIFSDMQFDSAVGRGAAQTQLERIKHRFHKLGMAVCGKPYPAPRIIFWNLRSGTVGFPAQANTENVQMLSGFSPALLKFFLEGGDVEEEEDADMVVVDSDGNEVPVAKTKKTVSPYNTVRKVLDDGRYNPVRRVLNDSVEGCLRDYHFDETTSMSLFLK